MNIDWERTDEQILCLDVDSSDRASGSLQMEVRVRHFAALTCWAVLERERCTSEPRSVGYEDRF